MMSDIEQAATEAFSEYIASCTVIVTSEEDSFDHGTGVAVRYREKHYILTAAHVLKPLQDYRKLRFLGRPDVPFKNVKKSDLPELSRTGIARLGTSEATSVNVSKCIFGKADEDIAAIEVENVHSSLPHTIFHDLSGHESIQTPVGAVASVFGFPGEIAEQVTHKVTGRRAAMALSLHIDVEIKDISVAPGKLDPAFHFITDYTFEEDSCDPKGMSGCGIWSRPKHSTGMLWSPYTTQLFGIQSAYYPRSKLLVVARIERVLNLLSHI